MTVWEELKARGLIAQVTDEDEIKEMVSDRGKYHRKYLSAGKTASMDGSPGK